jgi:hypothetical protein
MIDFPRGSVLGSSGIAMLVLVALAHGSPDHFVCHYRGARLGAPGSHAAGSATPLLPAGPATEPAADNSPPGS